jgi:predicted RecA/RadA family phage recombinase
MKNFIQRGDMITVTAPTGGVTSGQGVLVGSLFGVAATTAAEGESVEIDTVGVYELPKLVSAVIAAGDRRRGATSRPKTRSASCWKDFAARMASPRPCRPEGLSTSTIAGRRSSWTAGKKRLA